MQTIIRKAKNKQNPYAQIARSAVQDLRLSWQATGLLSYILSLPDDWQIHIVDLATRKKNKITATRNALNELISTGYVQRVKVRDKSGKFIRHDFLVFETAAPQERKAETITGIKTNNIFERAKWQQGERGNLNDQEAVIDG